MPMQATSFDTCGLISALDSFFIKMSLNSSVHVTIDIVFSENTLRTKVVNLEISFQMSALFNILFNFFPHHHLFDSFHNLPLW